MACKMCKQDIPFEEYKEFITEVIPQVDVWGVESLTDNQQAVFLGIWCPACYDKVEEG